MSSKITQFNSPAVVSNLDTYTYTVVNAGTKTMTIRLTDVVSPVGITITLKQGSSTLTSVTATVASELQCQTMVNCAAADTLSWVIASTTASDSGPNQIKAIINLKSLTGGEG